MDPCPFARILVENLSLRFSLSSKPSLSRIHPSTTPSPYFCKIKLKNFPTQSAAIPLAPSEENTSPSLSSSAAASYSLDKTQIDSLVEKAAKKGLCLKIEVYSGGNGSACACAQGKLMRTVAVPLDLRGAESRPAMIHSGWVAIGEEKKGLCAQLYLTVRTEPDPRFVFRFGGEPECSPQVFLVKGSVEQAVFTCKFLVRNSCDRTLTPRSSMSETSASRKWLASLKGKKKDQSSKERKGWSITIHDLSGSPVAMASMVTPFVPSPGSGLVSRSNPGGWLILRPGAGTWKPWGRLEAWLEPGTSGNLGYRFQVLHDTIATTTAATTVANSVISSKVGGKFTMDLSSNVVTPVNSPESSCDLGSWLGSGSRPGSGSGSDFGFLWPFLVNRGFVMSSTVEGLDKCGKAEVEVGVQHVTCTEDAAAYVALAAALDLSMDACRPFSEKLRKELRQQSQQSVV